jgi:hypothetical protein
VVGDLVSRPGNGDFARVVSATSGKEWFGEVLVWGPTGEPFLRDAETAEVRWFPRSWTVSVILGPPDHDPGPCSCPTLTGHTPNDGPEPLDRACPRHGDPETIASAILKAARR